MSDEAVESALARPHDFLRRRGCDPVLSGAESTSRSALSVHGRIHALAGSRSESCLRRFPLEGFTARAQLKPLILHCHCITRMPAASAKVCIAQHHISELALRSSPPIPLHCWCPQHSTTALYDPSRIDSAHGKR